MKPQDYSSYASHDKVWPLLPWYVNGSLKGAELELVEKHIRICLRCRRELAEQSTLYIALQRAPVVKISAIPSLERLMSRIRDEEESRRKPNSNAGWKDRWLAGWRTHFTAVLTPRRWAVALAMGVLVLALPWTLQWTSQDTVSSYHTVADRGSLGQFQENDIRVVFADHLAESEIDAILKSINGHVVDGPTQWGVYTIRSKGSGEPAHSLSKMLEELRANKGVVFAEPALPPEGGQFQKEGG